MTDCRHRSRRLITATTTPPMATLTTNTPTPSIAPATATRSPQSGSWRVTTNTYPSQPTSASAFQDSTVASATSCGRWPGSGRAG